MGLRVGADHVEAIRAYVRGDHERFMRINATWDTQGQRTAAALLGAAFHKAGRRRFEGGGPAQVVEFVGRVRGGSEGLAALIEPRAAERLLLRTFTDEDVDDIDDRTQGACYAPLLAGLIVEANLSDAELDAFLEESRVLADELLEDMSEWWDEAGPVTPREG